MNSPGLTKHNSHFFSETRSPKNVAKKLSCLYDYCNMSSKSELNAPGKK